eukprot:gene18590-20456_t
MLTAISAYLFGDASEEENSGEENSISQTEEIIGDWVFVDNGNLKGKDGQETADRKAKMAESWFVTPPSCFDGQSKQAKKNGNMSSLENLLIEHPSMSVYCPNSPSEGAKTGDKDGPSPKQQQTAVRGVVVSSKQQCKIFLNASNARLPLKDLGCNYENSNAFVNTRKGSKRSNKARCRPLDGRNVKKEGRRNGKHVGMVAQRGNRRS